MANDSPMMTFVLLPCLCIAVGVTFGYALERGQMADPSVIRNQIFNGDLSFAKFFISSMASGMLAMVFLSKASSSTFVKISSDYYLKQGEKGIASSTVGGLLLGSGMVLAGSCPITVFCQLGAMMSTAAYTFAGCLLGTLIYAVFQPALDGAFKPSTPKVTNPWLSSSFSSCALPTASLLTGVVCAFEVFRPSSLSSSWPPYVSGALIGCLHLPLAMGLGELLGGSSSFLVMWAQVLVGPLSSLSPIIQKFKWGFKRWWQIFYVGGIIAGGFLSASSANRLGQASSVSQYEALLGGMLACLGSRIAAGCTSGHGFSGTSLMHPTSFTLVVAMFLGAFGTLCLCFKW